MISTNITQDKDRVPFKEKLAYGIAGPVDILSVWVLVAVAHNVFNMELLLTPVQVGIILISLRFWDGIADPVMGWISDNTRSRWGRRRPYIVVGAILSALTYPLMWWFPASFEPNQIMLWVIGFGILFYTSFTIWCIPFQSLLMEMSPDYDERTRVACYRGIFQSLSGLLVGACWMLSMLPIFHVNEVASPINGMRWISIIISVIILILGPLPGIFVKERYYKTLEQNSDRKKDNVFKDVIGAFSCKPFIILCIFIFLFLMSQSFYDTLERYVGTYYVFGGDWDLASKFTFLGTGIFVITNLAMIYFFKHLSVKTEKKKCLFIGTFLICLMPFISILTFTPENPYLQFVGTLLKGAGYAGIWLMVPSMLADAIDFDEEKNGTRREGVFSSLFSWIIKFSFCFGFLLSNPLLELTGFNAVSAGDQSAMALENLRYGLFIIPSILFVIAFLSIFKFRLTRKAMEKIRFELENRRGIVN
jgi:GPH family glycoside/pentoside/hexuronide:cation symporter